MSTLKIFKEDFYKRLGGLDVFKGKTILDVGCGDGDDASYISKYAKIVIGIDIIKDGKWRERTSNKLKFKIGDAQKLPFKNSEFDGIFLKDVLHHVESPTKVMAEIKRVATKDAVVMIIEGNRYNPIFYVHMTKMAGHEHLSQGEFIKLISAYFPTARFLHFESHFLPFFNPWSLKIMIRVERLLDKLSFLKPILSYNAAIKK